ncbi:MAG: hypothetical protein ACRC8B_23030 [Aeromonas sobria]|uniref:hypothetical protein n=1 Tax=Aeromonas sobria TaxID=646 RepID=UPI003F3AFADD
MAQDNECCWGAVPTKAHQSRLSLMLLGLTFFSANLCTGGTPWQALVATAVGVVVGKWLPGIVPLNAVLGAAFTYFILARLTQQPILVQEASKC